MFRAILLSACGAGLAVGLLMAAVQYFTTEPLILAGEVFEKSAAAETPPTSPAHDHEGASPAAAEHHHDEGAWEPADGAERWAYTALANVLMGVAASAVLLGAMTIRGGTIDGRTGLLWGVAAFFAASLLPSLGLSPELPGTAAAEITSRQIWWLGTVASSAAGLALLVLAHGWWAKLAGLVLVVLPHVVGAPEPPTLQAAYPAALGAEFVVASLVVSALLWTFSGLSAGWLHARLSPRN